MDYKRIALLLEDQLKLAAQREEELLKVIADQNEQLNILTAEVKSLNSSILFYGTHALPISICVPVIRSNSRLYLVIRFSSNTFSSIPTLSGL